MEDNKPVYNKRPHLTKEERFPRCYKDVSKVLKIVKSCKGNLKTVLYNSKLRGAYLKKVQGLASNVLKNYQTVAKVIEKVGLLEKEPLLHRECAEVMVYELILGTGELIGESKPILTVHKYRQDILNAFQALDAESTSDLGPHTLPRYARVNSLVTSVPEILEELFELGYEQVNYNEDLSQEEYLELMKSLKTPQFLVDYHFPDLLVFSAGENLCQLKMYQKRKILLQDKSSYIPVKVLNPEPGSMVLDACAAPGMKTIHIAAMMQQQGVLHAYEKDKERFATLQKMIEQYKIKICETFHQDFKATEPTDSKARYILLDPSCSGSGMVNRMDSVTDKPDSKSESRLQKLAGFQIILLKHALKFPKVERVVYSTCSIHEEENEFVVHEALEAFKDQFRLVPVLPDWATRGSDGYRFGSSCLRSFPEKNLTNGFFVAAFERIDSLGERFAEKRKRTKKKRISESTVCENAYDMNCATVDNIDMNYEGNDTGDNYTKKQKKKKHKTTELESEENDEDIGDNHLKNHNMTKHEGEDMQKPSTADCEDEKSSKKKRKKKKHQSEGEADENGYNMSHTATAGVSNPFSSLNHEDGVVDGNVLKHQKRKKHKKSQREHESVDYETLACDGEEKHLETISCSESYVEEHSVKKNKKKHKTKHDGNAIGDSVNDSSSSSQRIYEVQSHEDAECSDSVKKHKRKRTTENDEQCRIDDGSVECAVADSKRKKKRKNHEPEVDERAAYQENEMGDGELAGSSPSKKHKKHKKKEKRSHSPKSDE